VRNSGSNPAIASLVAGIEPLKIVMPIRPAIQPSVVLSCIGPSFRRS
jgi:hypothetical protein